MVHVVCFEFAFWSCTIQQMKANAEISRKHGNKKFQKIDDTRYIHSCEEYTDLSIDTEPFHYCLEMAQPAPPPQPALVQEIFWHRVLDTIPSETLPIPPWETWNYGIEVSIRHAAHLYGTCSLLSLYSKQGLSMSSLRFHFSCFRWRWDFLRLAWSVPNVPHPTSKFCSKLGQRGDER